MDPIKDKALTAAIKRVSRVASDLYDLMENGMTIDFTFPERRTMVDRHRKSNHLIVTKPEAHMPIVIKQKEIDDWSPPVKFRRRK